MAETISMKQEGTSNPEGSMEAEEATGEELSTGGIKLSSLAVKAEAFKLFVQLAFLPRQTPLAKAPFW